MDVSSSLRPFPSLHIALNAGLQVASEKISIKTAKQKNSDIELQAYAGNLFAWIIMVYINYFKVPQRPHTWLFFRISRCRAHRRSHWSFPFILRSFSARHFAWKSEKFWLAIELRSRTQLFSRELLTDASNLRGLSSRSLVILLSVGIGGIHSVEIWCSKGVKCL